jgi:hypothetical protein
VPRVIAIDEDWLEDIDCRRMRFLVLRRNRMIQARISRVLRRTAVSGSSINTPKFILINNLEIDC